MKRMLVQFMFLMMFASPVFAFTAEEQSTFERANKLYSDGSYDKAAELYEGLSEQHRRSADLFYNLGNSYFRANKMGQAILAYERALTLKPRDRDIRENLKYLQDIQEYRLEDTRNWYVQTGDKLLRLVTEQEIYFLTLLTYFLFIAACVLVVFFQRGKPLGWARKVFLGVTVLCLTLAVLKNVQVRVIRDAIVMDKDAEVRYGPSSSDQVAFRLGEGMKVHVVNQREKWSRVILMNGESGWVRNSHIMQVQPQ